MRQSFQNRRPLVRDLFRPFVGSVLILAVVYGGSLWLGVPFGSGVFGLTLVTGAFWLTIDGEKRTARAVAVGTRHGLRDRFISRVSGNDWGGYATSHLVVFTLTVATVLGWILVGLIHQIL